MEGGILALVNRVWMQEADLSEGAIAPGASVARHSCKTWRLAGLCQAIAQLSSFRILSVLAPKLADVGKLLVTLAAWPAHRAQPSTLRNCAPPTSASWLRLRLAWGRLL
eukprot:6345631-Amphidinium_carterae.1